MQSPKQSTDGNDLAGQLQEDDLSLVVGVD
jgi:hypothetical protein